MTNKTPLKAPARLSRYKGALIIQVVSITLLCVYIIYSVIKGTLTLEYLGLILSILGLVIPVLFFFVSWLDETADRIDKIERSVIRNAAQIEYFGKFREAQENIAFLMRKEKITDENIREQ